MADDSNPSPIEGNSLDLSGLSDLSLGPDWGYGEAPQGRTPKVREDGERRERRGGGGQRDRRGPRPERRSRPGPDGAGPSGTGATPRGPRPEGNNPKGPRRDGGRDRRGFRPEREAPFEPLVAVDFYPDDKAFEALADAIRSSARTFELFEVARLILGKPERFVCLVKHPEQVEGQDALLHACVIDGLPFLSEDEAVAHALNHYIDQFLEVEEVEVDPPKGNFQMIHKCGVTGTLLGPPNYHRYQKLLEEHHASHVSRMPFHRFQEKLETVREQETIDAWLEQMKKQKRYKVKEDLEGVEPAAFDNFESARFHLLTHAKDKLVRPAYSAKFEGRALEKLSQRDPVRRSIEALHERQVRFPLDTANNLRSRLRRLNFSIYKRGSKGVSYVCAVKRRMRTIGEKMADNLSDLLAFLEAHPNLPQNQLPKEYLGVEMPEGDAASEMATEDKDKLASLRRDLRYLVTQGYVVEFSDGKLFAPPAMESKAAPAPKKEANPTPAKEPQAKEATNTTAPAPAPEAPSPEANAPEPASPEPERPTAAATIEDAPAPATALPPAAEEATGTTDAPPPVEATPSPVAEATPTEPAAEATSSEDAPDRSAPAS